MMYRIVYRIVYGIVALVLKYISYREKMYHCSPSHVVIKKSKWCVDVVNVDRSETTI